MKKYLILSVLVLIVFFSVYVYAADDPGLLSLDVEGSAKIKKNDVASAREEAIQDALENAILQAAAKLLAVPVKDERVQLIKSIIVKEPDKYIYFYKITGEKRQPQSIIFNANVVVALSSLKKDLYKMGSLQTPQLEKTNVTIVLCAKGLKKYSDFSHLKEFLQSRTKIVKNIYPCRFEWQQAQFEVEIFGEAQSLADEFAKKGKYLLDTKQTDKNRVEITCLQIEEEK